MSTRLTSSVIRRLESLGEHPLMPSPDSSPDASPTASPPSFKDHPLPNVGVGLAGYGGVRKSTYEIPRKILHSSIGFLTLSLYLSHPTPSSLTPHITSTLLSSLILIVPADILRLSLPASAFARLYNTLLGFLMRPAELSGPNGVIYYILGVSASLSWFPLDIAVYSILALSWADTAASTLGRAFGSRTGALWWAPSKSWAGFIGAAVVGAALAVAFWPTGDLLPPNLPAKTLLLALYAGITTGLAESLDVGIWLDDNLTLPILSGAALYLLAWL